MINCPWGQRTMIILSHDCYFSSLTGPKNSQPKEPWACFPRASPKMVSRLIFPRPSKWPRNSWVFVECVSLGEWVWFYGVCELGWVDMVWWSVWAWVSGYGFVECVSLGEWIWFCGICDLGWVDAASMHVPEPFAVLSVVHEETERGFGVSG